MLSVAGAISLKLGATAGGGAFAGAFTLNDLSRDVRAYASDATLTARNLSVSAVTDDQIVAVTAGIGGALKPTGTTAVIGSVGINDIESDTLAGLWGDVTVITSGDLDVLAKDSLTLTSVSGSIGFAGGALGAAVDVGLYDRTVRALIGPDPADGMGVADVDVAGNLSLKGLAEETIVSVGAAGAAGTQSFGAAGSASSQNLDTLVEAAIGDEFEAEQPIEGHRPFAIADANADMIDIRRFQHVSSPPAHWSNRRN